MKKNFAYIVLFFFLFFIIVNYKLFFAMFYNFLWNYYYNFWDYYNSLVFHTKAHNYLPNEIILYNIWNDFYKLEKYHLAIKNYDKLSLLRNKDYFLDSIYNLANSLYKLWETKDNYKEKLNLWKESLDLYLNLLANKEEKKVRDNYEFVKRKLDEINNEQKPKSNWNEEKKKNGKSNLSPKNENNTQTWSLERLDIYKLKLWEEIEKINSLEKQKVENYIEFLKLEQERNNIYFNNKKNTDNIPDNILDTFKNNPFFRDIFES